MNKKDKFKSRVLVDSLDVLAVINHLEDNFDDNKPLQVVLTIKPRKVDKTDYCSIKKRSQKIISVKDGKEILDISKLLTEKLFIATIHVDIK